MLASVVRALHNHKESPIEILNGNWKESDTLTSLCRSHQVHGEVTRAAWLQLHQDKKRATWLESEKSPLSLNLFHIYQFLPSARREKMHSQAKKLDFCQLWDFSCEMRALSCSKVLLLHNLRARQRQQLASWHLSRTNFSAADEITRVRM